MLDRKELEAFLSLNDLQQDDRLENVVNIGTRLGLNVIVVGDVEKKGAIILVNCKVVLIEQKKNYPQYPPGGQGRCRSGGGDQQIDRQIGEAISKKCFQNLC